MKKSIILVSVFLSISLSAREFVSIGTGGVTGTYYPIGGAICQIVNKNTKIKCSVQSTGGSVYNVNNVLKKELTFGFVQSDVVYDKYYGQGNFKGKKNDKLRSVMAVYPELLSFVVSKSSGVNKISDLNGKKYNVGNPGSGNEITTLAVFKAKNFDVNNLSYRGVLTAQECPHALKDKKIDGYSYMVGHPTANITDSAISLPINILEIDGPEIDDLIKQYPYFSKGIIPKNTYEGIDKDVKTIGVKAVLVTDASTSSEAISGVVHAVLNNFEQYKKLHPALKNLTKKDLLEGLSAPLHPVAKEIFIKAGLLRG